MKAEASLSRSVAVCNTAMAFPTELTELRDSNAVAQDPAALRVRMAEDGYLMIRGFHDRDVVLWAAAPTACIPAGPSLATLPWSWVRWLSAWGRISRRFSA